MNDNALSIIPQGMPAMEVAIAVERYKLLNSFIGQVLREGTDYGKIPGAGDKATLLKPGAEKLSMFFGLSPTFEQVRSVEDWMGKDYGGEPFFFYLIKCRLTKNGQIVAEGDGSCNSRESKYRYRSSERVCPNCGKPAIRRSKFPPRDNPKAEPGFYCHDKAGGCGAQFGAHDKAITEQATGRVPNPDTADQVNTILKMAEKRALIAATLIAVNASDYFTQDIEDLPGFGEIVETQVRVVQPQPAPQHAEPPADTVDAEFAAIPSATQERKAGNGDKPAPKLAVIKCKDFFDLATVFATQHPAWQNSKGDADSQHICASIAKLGFAEITAANIVDVFNKLEAHALSKEADAAA